MFVTELPWSDLVSAPTQLLEASCFSTSLLVVGNSHDNGIRKLDVSSHLSLGDQVNEGAYFRDGTPILDAAVRSNSSLLCKHQLLILHQSIASYLSFFALVWWVWASQVAYNVRFRQSDWLHRIFAFFQLVVFCALAAFTNNYDVTNGIVDDSREEKKLMDIQMADFYSAQDVAAANFRNNRVPTLNARGISLTMGFSRLLLLVQYLLGEYHRLLLSSIWD